MNPTLEPDAALVARVAPLLDRRVDDDESLDIAARTAWSCLAEPGDGIAGRLVSALGAAEALHEALRGRSSAAASPAQIPAAEWARATERWRPRAHRAEVHAALEKAARAGVRLLVPSDPRWPGRLDDLGEHAPLCLWALGDLRAAGRGPAVAVVGARAATGYGEHVAMELAAELAGRGIPVVSGAAYGIDAAAHRAALGAGGVTTAVLAGGVDRAYPAGNADLLERIAARGGAVLSEVPCGSSPTKWRFLQRNRVIAALADATVVVEAGWRSGALNTASHAAQLGRPVGIVPGSVTSAASAGCHRLLRTTDAMCVTSADEVVELLGGSTPTLFDPAENAARNDARAGERTDDRTRVRDALSVRVPRAAAEVARRSGMSLSDVESLLGLMSLTGDVAASDGDWRLVRTAPRVE